MKPVVPKAVVPAEQGPLWRLSHHGVLVCLWLLWTAAAPAWATRNLRFERFTTDNGLAQVTIQCLWQDEVGFLWLGTRAGLIRYDGANFKAFGNDPFDVNTLLDNDVRVVFQDSQARFWVGTRAGLNLMETGQRGFSRYALADTFGQDHNLEIHHLAEDGQGGLWVGTSGGLAQFDARLGRFTLHRPRMETAIAGNQVAALVADSAGEYLLVGCADGGLYRFDPTSARFQALYRVEGPGGSIRDLYIGRAGQIWVATDGQGILRIDWNGQIQARIQHDPTRANSLRADAIVDMIEDDDGNFWVANDEKGLSVRLAGEDFFRHYVYNPDVPTTLSNSNVDCLLIDRSGVLWVGTHGGLNKLTPNRLDFHHYRSIPGDPNTLSGDLVWAMHATDDSVWVGTEDNGLNRMDRATENFVIFQNEASDPTSLSDDTVYALITDGQGQLWVGTRFGLNRFDPATQSFQRYFHDPGDPSTLTSSRINSLCNDADGGLWVGTINGLNYVDVQTGRVTRYQHDPADPTSLPYDKIWGIFQDSQGHLWIGTDDGLHQKMADQDTFFTHRLNPDNPGSLSSSQIGPIYEDKRGVLWVGTELGLNQVLGPRAEPGELRFRHFTRKDGLPQQMIYGLVEDQAGNLWISTNEGLVVLDSERNVVRNYDINDGLQSNEFSSGVSSKTADGMLFFGGVNGFNAFDPAQLTVDVPPPSLALTAVQINNEPLRRREPIHQIREFELTHEDYIVSIEFAALDFTNPSKNRYAFRLLNFDDSWSTPQARRFATFTNLDPGHYDFQVKAMNGSGSWSRPVGLSIAVKPAPWRTPWAYTLYGLILAGAVVGYISSQRRKLNAERTLVQRLTQVDRLKNEFLANTSHELRTPLYGIIGLAESLRDSLSDHLPSMAVADLDIIVASGKRLGNLVNDILDFSKLSRQELVLRRHAVDLRSVTSVVFAISKPLIGDKPLQLHNDIPIKMPAVFADENRLQQILYNLIGNAIKFTLEGDVRVRAEVNGDLMYVHVEDTGIGIAESEQERIFESFEQADGSAARVFGGTGLGLAITKQLVELHGGTVGVSSQPNQGSRFTFTLPVSEEKPSVMDLSLSDSNPYASSDGGTAGPESGGVAARETGRDGGNTGPESGGVAARETGSHQASHARLSDAEKEAPTASMSVPALQTVDDQAATAATIPAMASGMSPSDFRILIVDDEPVNRRVLSGQLVARHYQVVEAGDGIEALKILEREAIDLVLLDIMMPRLSGYEVCQKIRKKRGPNELPVIFLTARTQISDLVSGFSHGGNDYLIKPVSREELLSRVRIHLLLLDIHRHLEKKVADRTRDLEQKNQEVLQAQKQLMIKEKMASLGMLTAGIAHEIKNPLNFVNNFAWLSLETCRELRETIDNHLNALPDAIGDDFMSLLDEMEQNSRLVNEHGKRADHIVHSMMALVRGDTAHPEKVDLNALVKRYVKLAVHGAGLKDRKFSVSVRSEYDPALGEIDAVGADLGRVIINLVTNAIDAMGRKAEAVDGYQGVLTVRTQDQGDQVLVAVHDNGPGIDPAKVDKVFEPFFTTKPGGKGNVGLGLSICYDIITHQHGGSLDLASELGAFTEFTIRLPREQKPAGT